MCNVWGVRISKIFIAHLLSSGCVSLSGESNMRVFTRIFIISILNNDSCETPTNLPLSKPFCLHYTPHDHITRLPYKAIHFAPPRGPLASTTQGYFSIFLTIHHQKPFLILDFYTLAHSLGITLLISVSKTYSERQSRNPQKCHYYVRPKSKEMGLRLSPGCRNAALSSGASGSTLLGREDVEGGKNTGFVPQVYA